MNENKNRILNAPTGPIWEKIGIYPHHGIDLPLSSLHSKNSCGIGEFLDILPLIDLCKEIKFDVIQLLPLNDSGTDPSPYNALSSCALNPIYISLYALPHLEKLPDLKKEISELQKLSKSQRVAYQEVQISKIKWLRKYFAAIGPELIKSDSFSEFMNENSWIKSYALFKALKERLDQANWIMWPQEFKHLDDNAFSALIKEHWTDVLFYIVLQFFCHCQFTQVKNYAASKQVLIKGDIPILISPDSADVWHNSEFFFLSLHAGAPPDAYNKKGQYWGFPLYNWELMKKNHYKWWKQRLAYASKLYDIYRIDHVVGFFRIWAITPGQIASKGKFVPENENLWPSHGKELLEMLIHSSTMLPIAEDLGVVPTFVRPILLDLGICGTKVMRWERRWKEDGGVIPIQEYPALSLTCVSTHDSDTLQLWWKHYPDEAEIFAKYKNWHYDPELSIDQRKVILWDSHHTSSLFHINLFQEYLALFPELIWQSPEDERINIPGEVLSTNWNYRFRPSIEELTTNQALKSAMHNLVFGEVSFEIYTQTT